MASEIKDVLVQDALDVLEKAKFGIDDENHVYVRTSLRGILRPGGLNVEGKTTCMQITTSAQAMPATALADRNYISIANLDDTKTLYLGYSTGVTADRAIGNTAGIEIGPGETWNKDITDNVIVYGISASGNILIKIDENA